MLPFGRSHQIESSPSSLRSKVVFVGDTGVGKTSIILRHDGQGFTSKMSPTLGASYITSEVSVNSEQKLELQIWDTAGQERFRSMIPMYLRNAEGAFIVYDITCRSSFENLHSWVADLKRSSDPERPLKLSVLGNKTDLSREHRVVQSAEGAEFADLIGADFHESSALSGNGIQPAFHRLAESLAERKAMEKETAVDEERIELSDRHNAPSRKHSRSHRRFCC